MFTRTRPWRRHLAITGLLLVLQGAFTVLARADAAAPGSLAEAVDLALASGSLPAEAEPGTGASRWLAMPATIAVAHLESDQRLGTNETEISLSFPFKSPAQRRSDRILAEVDPRLEEASQRYRRWYLSGTLRDLYARHRRAQAAARMQRAAVNVLERFEQQLAAGVGAGGAERYDLLVVQRMRAEMVGRLNGRLAEGREALRLYESLTGAAAFPEDAGDDAPLVEAPLYENHPELTLLDLNRERELAALRSSAPETTPWTVALIGRDFDLPEFSERQLGVAVEIPVGPGGRPSPSTRSSERALRRDYRLQRDERLAALRLAWTELRSERSALLARQALLTDSFDAQGLEMLLAATRQSAELPIEVRLQRLLTLLEMQAEPAQLALEIEANAAAMRQLAGQSL